MRRYYEIPSYSQIPLEFSASLATLHYVPFFIARSPQVYLHPQEGRCSVKTPLFLTTIPSYGHTATGWKNPVGVLGESFSKRPPSVFILKTMHGWTRRSSMTFKMSSCLPTISYWRLYRYATKNRRFHHWRTVRNAHCPWSFWEKKQSKPWQVHLLGLSVWMRKMHSHSKKQLDFRFCQ